MKWIFHLYLKIRFESELCRFSLTIVFYRHQKTLVWLWSIHYLRLLRSGCLKDLQKMPIQKTSMTKRQQKMKYGCVSCLWLLLVVICFLSLNVYATAIAQHLFKHHMPDKSQTLEVGSVKYKIVTTMHNIHGLCIH